MNWSKHRGGEGRRGYHHGNLREALIRGALALIAEKGPAGFTIADAARSAGVSPAAPYRHFRDRDDLMADVARLGFEEFAARLPPAWNERPAKPVPRLRGCRQGLSRLCAGRTSLLCRDVRRRNPGRADAGTAPGKRAGLRSPPRSVGSDLPDLAEGQAAAGHDDGTACLGVSHGIASLFGRGGKGGRKTPMSPEDLLEAAILIYFQGLGIDLSGPRHPDLDRSWAADDGDLQLPNCVNI